MRYGVVYYNKEICNYVILVYANRDIAEHNYERLIELCTHYNSGIVDDEEFLATYEHIIAPCVNIINDVHKFELEPSVLIYDGEDLLIVNRDTLEIRL